MLRNTRPHVQRHLTNSSKRWFVATIESAGVSGGGAASSSASSASSSSGRRVAAYIAAGGTAGAFTCYRPDELVANDPYNISSSVLALLAHRAVNGPMINYNIVGLIGCLVVGEFLGNGFRHTRRQFFSITVTDQERHQLLGEVAKIADLDKTHAMEKDLLDTFENTISNILIQAKTRWVHLNDSLVGNDGKNGVTLNRTITNGKVPREMTTQDLELAIRRMSNGLGISNKDDEKEALRQVLSVADIDNDGIITFHEFTRALLLLEFAKRDLPNAKAELYFRAIDLHNNGVIDQKELLHFAKRLYALGGIPHQDRTVPHWSGMYQRLATPEEVCKIWMNRFDLNHDGLISREEFYKMAQEIDFGPSFLFTKYFDRTTE